MAKDYAKRVFTTRKPKKNRLRAEFVIVFLLILIAASVGYWFYSQKNTTSSGSYFSRVKTMFEKKSSQPQQVAAKSKPVDNAQAELHFDFYNQLPNMQVTVPEEGGSAPLKPLAKAPEPVKTVAQSSVVDAGYILQVGVFKDASSASQMRLSMLLSGFEVELVKAASDEGDVYRLQKGPFALADAKVMQKKLEKKGIVSLVKKL